MPRIIYIVDDQPAVLQTLGYILRHCDPKWNISEFPSAAKALDAVRQKQPHLVLSDQSMPQMTGSEMLEIVREIAPQTIRIIISGHAASTNKIASAHQFLSKPFDHREILARVKQALTAQAALKNSELAQLVMSLRSFSALPAVYTKLVRELEKDDSSADRIVALLKRDGGTLTRVMQLANSPLFRGDTTITEPAQAMFHLGTNNLKSLVLSLHVFDAFPRLDFPEISVEELWRHSWDTATAARNLCADLGESAASEAFFAGLVHGLGRLILMENQPDRYRRVCQRAINEKKSLEEIETEAFGVCNADLTAFMLRLWGMADGVIDAVSHHRAPWDGRYGKQFSPTVALYVANIQGRLKNCPDRFVTPALNQDYLDSVRKPDRKV